MKYIFTILLLVCGHILCTAQWNPNTSINLEVAAVEVADLQTATTSDGRTWIAYYHNNAGNYDMRAQLLDVEGNKELGPNGVLVSNQTSGSATFVFNVCLDASNNLIIAYQYEVAGVNTAVISKVNTDGSLPWGSSGIQLGAGLAPYPAVLTTGETVVGWNNSSPSTLYLQKIAAAGTIVWALPVPVMVGASNTTRGQIVANLNGSFTLVLQRKGVGISTTLFAQRYNSDGIAQWALPVQLSTLTTSGARYYSILASADTSFFGYYASDVSRFHSYVQRINPDGAIPWGANGSVFSTYSTGAEPYQQTTNIAHAPGSPYLWAVCTYSNTLQSQYGVYVQKFNISTGTVLLDPLGKEVYPVSANMDTQAGELVLNGPDAPAFISYDLDYKIKLAALNSAGTLLPGYPSEMSSTTATIGAPKGRFAFNYSQQEQQAVAVWYENRGTEYRAYAQNKSLQIVPVTLADFRAVKNNKQADLYWNTAAEIDNTGFFVERSTDGIHFKTAGFVNTKAAGGNSSLNINYSFSDGYPFPSYNYYRLKQVDINGRSSYSKILLLRFDKQGDLFINNIYPTPATSVLHISAESAIQTNGSLSVVDINGKTASKISIIINKGNNIFDIDVSALAKGMYILKISSGNNVVTEKWIKE